MKNRLLLLLFLASPVFAQYPPTNQPMHSLMVFTNSGRFANGSTNVLQGIVGLVNVWDFGATGNGVTDETAAFQAAVNFATNQSVVFVPDGLYVLTGSVIMPPGVHIVGTSTRMTAQNVYGGDYTLGAGSIILDERTSRQIEFPAPGQDLPGVFVYNNGNSFEGITFLEPLQVCTNVSAIPYPPVFTPSLTTPSQVILDTQWTKLQFINCYWWIDARWGNLNLKFDDLYGSALFQGISIDGGGGFNLLHDIQVNGFYPSCQGSDNLAQWALTNCTGISIYRSDGIHLDTGIFDSINEGIYLGVGSVNVAGGPYGSMVGVSCDGVNFGVMSTATHSIGMDFTDFLCDAITNAMQIYQKSSQLSTLRFHGGKIWGSATNDVLIGTNAIVSFDGTKFSSFISSAILITNSGDFAIANCRFDNSTATPLQTLSVLTNLMMNNNLFDAAPILVSPTAGVFRINGNTYIPDNSHGD